MKVTNKFWQLFQSKSYTSYFSVHQISHCKPQTSLVLVQSQDKKTYILGYSSQKAVIWLIQHSTEFFCYRLVPFIITFENSIWFYTRGLVNISFRLINSLRTSEESLLFINRLWRNQGGLRAVRQSHSSQKQLFRWVSARWSPYNL